MRDKTSRIAWLGVLTACALATACGSFPASSPQTGAPVAANGAALWADNCRRCHNFRSPASLTDAQWDIAALHMRVRANLTADEHRAILQFLQAGN